jgi:hypothetical protein
MSDGMMTKRIAREQRDQWAAMNARRPGHAEIIQNLASCLFTLGETEEAIKLFDEAYMLNRDSAAIAMNYGMLLKELGHFGASAEKCFHAYILDPTQVSNGAYYAKLGWCESLLRNGNWRDAWLNYDDSRFGTREGCRNIFSIPDSVPLWRGEPLAPDANKLLVVGEGGTGDRITYSRWLPELDKQGIDWAYYPDAAPPIPGVLSLFARVPWLQNKIPGPGYQYNAWTTVFSLPACLNATPTTIPRYPSFFLPDPELKKKYEIPRNGKPVYGLIWGANELFEGGMKFRSLLESQAMRLVLATQEKCVWVNCWMGDAHGTNSKLGFPVVNPKFENWEETAALLANMDGIVSTDNGACWLAHALGLPVSILLSGNSDWKFLRGTDKCYWSDRARLFRNEGQGFENAVDKLIASINRGEGVGRAL